LPLLLRNDYDSSFCHNITHIPYNVSETIR